LSIFKGTSVVILEKFAFPKAEVRPNLINTFFKLWVDSSLNLGIKTLKEKISCLMLIGVSQGTVL